MPIKREVIRIVVYDILIPIKYNTLKKKNKGSAIFLHLTKIQKNTWM